MREPTKDQRICMMGMGYVGLTLGAVMADRGFTVAGIEINPDVLKTLQEGRAHFFERNLDLVIGRNVRRGTLSFSETIPADEHYDVYVVTVGTPLADDEATPRMEMVRNVAKQIGDHMEDGALIILRSTVRLGTTENVVKPILDATGKKYDLAFCPERTMEGKALEELPSLPQIVGGWNQAASQRAMNLFRHLTPTILEVSNVKTAELIKLLDNSYRDVFFSFGNQVALMAEAVGLDAQEVIQAANTGYARTNIAKPGFVGGPCLYKDPHILAHSLRDFDTEPSLINAGRALNRALVSHVLGRCLEAVKDIESPRIVLMGMAFKGQPDNDDLRNSPSVDLLKELQIARADAQIYLQDHIVKPDALRALGGEVCDQGSAFKDSHVVMLLNNNHRYASVDIEAASQEMREGGLIADVWNMLSVRDVLPNGVQHYVLGRAPTLHT